MQGMNGECLVCKGFRVSSGVCVCGGGTLGVSPKKFDEVIIASTATIGYTTQ